VLPVPRVAYARPMDDPLPSPAGTQPELATLKTPGTITGAIAWPMLAAVAALLMAVSVATQWHMGAYGAELGYDEASHYVSGVMIHDYLLHGLGMSPTRFLTMWHSHYPLVGIGHWGPVYYGVEAVWMLIAGTSRASALVLSAAIAALIGTIISAVAARHAGRVPGILAGLAFVISPIVQEGTGAVMLDLPITLLCLAAALSYASWMRDSGWRWALAFALLAASALLVKGNAACLGLLPPFVVLIGWRWDLPRRWTFWLPAPIVLVLAGPWYMATFGLIAPGWRYTWGWTYTREALLANSQTLLTGLGPILLAACVLGFIMACRRRGRIDDGIVCMAALLAAIWMFQCIVPVAIQDRYLAPALPPLLILAAWVVTRLLPRPLWRGVAMAVLVLALVPGAVAVDAKQRYGMLDAAAQVWANVPAANPVVLIASDGAAEVGAVAALAERDPTRPSLFAVRGARLLGGGGYNREDYLPRYATPRDVMSAIDAYAIPLVILLTRDGGNEWSHIDQVAEAARLFPTRWELIWHEAIAGYQVQLFRITDNAAKPGQLRLVRVLNAPQHLTEQTPTE
jgi:hypothetical protein